MEFKQQQQQERIFENTCVAVNIKTKKILAMQITDEHLHDGKALPELVDGLLKSDKTLGKLFADDEPMKVMIFLDVLETMDMPCIKIRKNSRFDGKKGTSLEIYQCWHKEMICKSGRIA